MHRPFLVSQLWGSSMFKWDFVQVVFKYAFCNLYLHSLTQWLTFYKWQTQSFFSRCTRLNRSWMWIGSFFLMPVIDRRNSPLWTVVFWICQLHVLQDCPLLQHSKFDLLPTLALVLSVHFSLSATSLANPLRRSAQFLHWLPEQIFTQFSEWLRRTIPLLVWFFKQIFSWNVFDFHKITKFLF